MLPIRVRLAQMLELASSDAGVLRRLISLAIVIVLVIGVATSGGVSLNLQIGRPDTAGAAGGARQQAAGSDVGADGGDGGVTVGEVAAGDPSASGSSGRGAGASTASPGAGGRGSGTAAASTAGVGPSPAAAAACKDANLRDMDNGVTKDGIKVVLLQTDLAALAAAGFGLAAGNVDYPKIAAAWANALNKAGGVACRKVTILHDKTDLSVDAQLASCKKWTQDEKAFTIFSPGGLVAGAPCITKDNKTPLVVALAAPEYWSREGAPYLWDVLQSQERMLKNHVKWAVDSGLITKDKSHVGVLYTNEPYGGPAVEGAMVPEFKKQGIKVRVAKLPYEFEQASAQIPQVVVDWQSAGVDHVVMPTNIIAKTQFMQQAEQQNYYPTYSEDDATVGCQDFLTGTYPQQSWDGTKCVSNGLLNGAPNGMRPAELASYIKGNAFAQKADAIYLATHSGGYSNGGESDEDDTLTQQHSNYLVGSLFSMWAQAANRAGPDLTRKAWGAAMEKTGTFDQVVSPKPYSFGPGKWSGPDYIQMVQWRAAAGEGYEERRYRKITDFIKAPY